MFIDGPHKKFKANHSYFEFLCFGPIKIKRRRRKGKKKIVIFRSHLIKGVNESTCL